MEAIELLTQRVSPAQLVEPGPTPQQLEQILAAAVRAPDHDHMQPWRFILIEGEARDRLGELMVQSLHRRDPQAPEGKRESERKKAKRAPLVVVVAAAVKDSTKVPPVEQIVAVGAAAENMIIAAHAVGLGAFWRTGAIAYDAEVKQALGLDDGDQVIGFIYIGSIGAPGRAKPAEIEPVVRRW